MQMSQPISKMTLLSILSTPTRSVLSRGAARGVESTQAAILRSVGCFQQPRFRDHSSGVALLCLGKGLARPVPDRGSDRQRRERLAAFAAGIFNGGAAPRRC